MTITLDSARPTRRPLYRAAAILSVAFALGMGLGLLPSGMIARACSCLPPPPPPVALQAASAVFDGTVTRIELTDPAAAFSSLRVSFVVHTQWKGVSSGTLTVTTAGNSALCGVYFKLGTRYLVYVTSGTVGGSVDLCSRTREYDVAEAQALGPDTPPPGAEPFEGRWDLQPPSAGCPRCAAPPPPREAMAEADAVFHGRAIGVTFLGAGGDFDHVITFQNLGWWKGPDSATIDLRVPWNVWFCGDPFGDAGTIPDLGEFLVYAKRAADGSLTISLCGRTKAYDAAEAAELGTPNPPRTAQGTGTPSSTATPANGTPPPDRTPTATPTPPSDHTPTPQSCPTIQCPPCAGPRPAAEWLAEASAVFHGRVTTIDPVGCDYRVHFAVDEVWKGSHAAQQTVRVDAMAWQCGRQCMLGEAYVVFAEGDAAGGLRMGVCFGIVDGDARDQLGPGVPVGGGGPGGAYLPWLGRGP